jgi:hypothetical protein
MSLAYIKFSDRDGEAEGIHILARRSPVTRFRDRVYRVQEDDLHRLEEAGIGYRRATEAEIEVARDVQPSGVTASR